MRYTDEYGIAVMVKYPAEHPNYRHVPEWHPWGGEVFAFTDPSLTLRIHLVEQDRSFFRQSILVGESSLVSHAKAAYTALKACETIISVVNIVWMQGVLINQPFLAKLVTTCEIAPQLIFRPHMIRILMGHVSPITVGFGH